METKKRSEDEVEWIELDKLASFHKSSSFCPEEATTAEERELLLGNGAEGNVSEWSLALIRTRFGDTLYRRVRAQVPDKKATLAIKSMRNRGQAIINAAFRGTQAQFQAGTLTRGPRRVCVGITPVYAAWRCVHREELETLYVVMPKRDTTLDNWARGLRLDTTLLETEWVPNLLRLVTALVALHSIRIVHQDIHGGNVLTRTLTEESPRPYLRFHHDQQSLVLPPPATTEMEITDFGWATSTANMEDRGRNSHERKDLSDSLKMFYSNYRDWMERFRWSLTDVDKSRRRKWIALLGGLGKPGFSNEEDETLFVLAKDSLPKLGAYDSVWQVLQANRDHPWLANWMGKDPSLPEGSSILELHRGDDLTSDRSSSAASSALPQKTEKSRTSSATLEKNRASSAIRASTSSRTPSPPPPSSVYLCPCC